MSINAKPIAVIGAGSWGTALAICLAQNQQPTRLWGHDAQQIAEMQATHFNARYLPNIPLPSNLEVFAHLSEVLAEVDDILIAVPSHAFREVLTSMLPHLKSTARIAWATKGLDPSTGKFLSEVVSELMGEQTMMAALSGPSFAKEVAVGLPTAISLASNNQMFSHDLTLRLHSSYFRVYENPDMIGLQICGTVKNVLAIAAGVADGLKLGANARSALITRGLAEMSRLCVAMGGQWSTVMGLAGVGDLVLTCTDNQSRNRRFGLAIAEGQAFAEAIREMGQVVEGYANTEQIYALAQRHTIEMPITEQIHKVLYQSTPVTLAINELLAREPRDENFAQ